MSVLGDGDRVEGREVQLELGRFSQTEIETDYGVLYLNAS